MYIQTSEIDTPNNLSGTMATKESPDKSFNAELLLKVLDQVFCLGDGKWVARCPSCTSNERTLTIQQDLVAVEDKNPRLSRYGSLSCSNLCTVGSIISELGFNSSTLFFDETQHFYELPGEFQYLMPTKTAISVLNEEIESFSKGVGLQNLDWNDERNLNQVYFIFAGLRWMLRCERHNLAKNKSSADSNSSSANWGCLDV